MSLHLWDLLALGVRTFVAKALVFPLHRSRIISQCYGELKRIGRRPYTSNTGALLHRESIFGQFHGLSAEVLDVVINEVMHRALFASLSYTTLSTIFENRRVMGTLFNLISLVITQPLHFAMILLCTDLVDENSDRKTSTTQPGKHRYTGIIDVWVQTTRERGFFTLYSGMFGVLLWEVVHRNVHWELQLLAKDRVLPIVNRWCPMPELAFSMVKIVASAAAGMITYPLTTIWYGLLPLQCLISLIGSRLVCQSLFRRRIQATTNACGLHTIRIQRWLDRMHQNHMERGRFLCLLSRFLGLSFAACDRFNVGLLASGGCSDAKPKWLVIAGDHSCNSMLIALQMTDDTS